MSKPDLSIAKYNALIYKLATQGNVLGQARKLLEGPPQKQGWWKRFWGDRK